MRKRLIIAVVLLNAALAAALLASPAATQVLPASLFEDCCKNAGTPSGFCCFNCCFFTHDCNDDEDCREN